MKIKFTLVDYIIIILVICAIAFAFIHITSDDSSDLQKTAFDESTINKIPDTYLKYYKDGFIVRATVEGFNSTTGEQTTINGIVVWEEDNGGNVVNLLINSDNETYLVGLYRTVPNADIYIDHIILESNGEKYKNLYEITAKPIEINSLKELSNKIPDNTNYEISTDIALDSLSTKDAQKISNLLISNGKRESIKTSNDKINYLFLKKATKENLNDADSVLGEKSGLTDEVTIRVYDAQDSQIKEISKNFDIINIRKF